MEPGILCLLPQCWDGNLCYKYSDVSGSVPRLQFSHHETFPLLCLNAESPYWVLETRQALEAGRPEFKFYSNVI